MARSVMWCAFWAVVALASAQLFESSAISAEAHAQWLARGPTDTPPSSRTLARWSAERQSNATRHLSLGLLALSGGFLSPLARAMLCAGTLGVHRGSECRGVSGLQYVPAEGQEPVPVDGVVVLADNDARRVIFAYCPRAHAPNVSAGDALRDAVERADIVFSRAVLPWLRAQRDIFSWQQVHVGAGDGGAVAALVASRVLLSASLPFAALGLGNTINSVCAVTAAASSALQIVRLPFVSPVGSGNHVALLLGERQPERRDTVDAGVTLFSAPVVEGSAPVVALREEHVPKFAGVGLRTPDAQVAAIAAANQTLAALHLAASSLPSALKEAAFALYGGEQRALVNALSVLVQLALGDIARVECTHVPVGVAAARDPESLREVGLHFGARCEAIVATESNGRVRHPLAQFLARVVATHKDLAGTGQRLGELVAARAAGHRVLGAWDTCATALVADAAVDLSNSGAGRAKRASPLHSLLPNAQRTLFVPSLATVVGGLFRAVDGQLDAAVPAESEAVQRAWAFPLDTLRTTAPSIFLHIASSSGVVFPAACTGVVFGPRPPRESALKASNALRDLVPHLQAMHAARPAVVGGRIMSPTGEAFRDGAGIFGGISAGKTTVDFAKSSRNATVRGGARLSAATVRVLSNLDAAAADVRDCTAPNASWVTGWCPAECIGAGGAVHELCSAVVHLPVLKAYAMGQTSFYGSSSALRALSERMRAGEDALVLHFNTRWYGAPYGHNFALLFNRELTAADIDATEAL